MEAIPRVQKGERLPEKSDRIINDKINDRDLSLKTSVIFSTLQQSDALSSGNM